MQYPKPEPPEAATFRFSPHPNRAHKIHWLEWSPEAFDKASDENKPILLSISAVWCHWCHVMDETSYSDEAIITFINENYVPIRVDADKRPDVQNRYLMGGWPTTAILTETGEILTGGTYVPPEQLLRTLEVASDYYREHHAEIENEAAQRRDQIMALESERAPVQTAINRTTVNDVVRELSSSFDSEYGGFGEAPKFPNPPAIELLLRRAFLENDTYLLEMARLTLDNMAKGELFDHVWGGFFRYATERDWSAPHYEKLLSENAELIVNYLHGFQVSDFVRYREIAETALDYVERFLAHKETGGFSGSQDADEEFYKLPAGQRTAANMPFIDPTVYVDGNSLMVSAYIKAYEILENSRYFDFARKTISFLLDTCYSETTGMAHFYDGKAHFLGMLSDQAAMLMALIDAYGATGDRSYLDTAKQLMGICENAYLARDGAFYDRANDSGEPEIGALFIRHRPLRENALMARALYRLAYIDGSDRYENMAEQALGALDIDGFGPIPAVALYGLAADEIITQPVVLTIIGSKNEAGTRALLKEVWRDYIPGKEIRLLDPIKDYEVIQKSGFPPEHHPVMYPCIGRMCLPPIETPHEFRSLLEDLPGRPK